jgi:hypothetical protein
MGQRGARRRCVACEVLDPCKVGSSAPVTAALARSRSVIQARSPAAPRSASTTGGLAGQRQESAGARQFGQQLTRPAHFLLCQQQFDDLVGDPLVVGAS